MPNTWKGNSSVQVQSADHLEGNQDYLTECEIRRNKIAKMIHVKLICQKSDG